MRILSVRFKSVSLGWFVALEGHVTVLDVESSVFQSP